MPHQSPQLIRTLCLSSILLLPLGAQAHKSENNDKLKEEVNDLQHKTIQQQKQIAKLNHQVSLLLSQNAPQRIPTKACCPPQYTPNIDANPLNINALPAPNLLPTKYTGKPGTVAPCASSYPIGSALYIKQNFPNFNQIITQNSPQSYADRNICINGLLCISGLANFDLFFTDRAGHNTNDGINLGSFQGLGVRPLFGSYDKNFFGSINNINLFIDAGLGNWFDMHIDLAYINGSAESITYTIDNLDWTTSYSQAAALKVNQAYVLIANPAVTPFFIQLGRYNAPFGYYEPFPIVPSLTQLISETRTGGIMAGAILPSGFYGEASWFMAKQSLENFNDVYIGYDAVTGFGFGSEPVDINNKDRNYGGKIGFRGSLMNCKLFANVNASYMADIRDTNYIQGAWDNYNLEFKNYPVISEFLNNVFLYTRRADAIALHADFAYSVFGLSGDYVTALSNLNPNNNQSKISAYGIEGSILLPLFCHMPSKFSFGYQHAEDSDIFTLLAPLNPPFQPPALPPFLYGDVLPHYRYVASYSVHILPPITATLEWINDHDFKPPVGSNRSSNFAVMRLGFQL